MGGRDEGAKEFGVSLPRILKEVDLHSFMSGKYAQKRVIGSRTVCLNKNRGVREMNQALYE